MPLWLFSENEVLAVAVVVFSCQWCWQGSSSLMMMVAVDRGSEKV